MVFTVTAGDATIEYSPEAIFGVIAGRFNDTVLVESSVLPLRIVDPESWVISTTVHYGNFSITRISTHFSANLPLFRFDGLINRHVDSLLIALAGALFLA